MKGLTVRDAPAINTLFEQQWLFSQLVLPFKSRGNANYILGNDY